MIEFLTNLQWTALLQIVMIDVLLGGDNAVAIALACRELDARQRKRGILWGVAGAVVMRLVLVLFALQLLEIPFLKFVGGLLLLWIGVKLLRPVHEAPGSIRAGNSVWAAVKTILIADFVMSLDNIIGIAGAAQTTQAQHQFGYVAFGLILSVPIIIWGSALVLRLIDRYPVVILLGAGLLGWIAGGMMITDVFVIERLGEPSQLTQWAAPVAGAALVVMAGKFLEPFLRSRMKAKANTAENTHRQTGSTNMTLLKWLALLGIVGIAAYVLLRQFAA